MTSCSALYSTVQYYEAVEVHLGIVKRYMEKHLGFTPSTGQTVSYIVKQVTDRLDKPDFSVQEIRLAKLPIDLVHVNVNHRTYELLQRTKKRTQGLMPSVPLLLSSMIMYYAITIHPLVLN